MRDATEGVTSSVATSSVATKLFPFAAQPDIVRAVQKDILCLGILESSVTDVVQGLLGPAAVFRHREALRMLTSLLYHGSSTGLGQQTLGEEYCDLLQVTASKLPPSTLNAAVQVLIKSLSPYVYNYLESHHPEEDPSPAEDLSMPDAIGKPDTAREPSSAPSETSADIISAGASAPASTHHTQHSSQPAALERDAWDSQEASARTSDQPQSVPHDANGMTLDTLTGSSGDSSPQPLPSTPAELGSNGNDGTASDLWAALPSHVQRFAPGNLQQLGSVWCLASWSTIRRFRGRAKAYVSVAARWMPLLLQLNLALFYIYGRYYQLSKRATGTSLVYTGSSVQPRPYYGVMGVLLLVQIAVQAWQLRCAPSFDCRK